MKGNNVYADLSTLVNNPKCADVKFLVGPESEEVYALSHVLIARSETFAEMLAEGEAAGPPTDEYREVPIEDVRPAVFLLLLTYVYTGDCGRITAADKAFDLYTSAELYELPKLQAQVLKALPSLLTDLHVVLEVLRKCQFSFHERLVRKCVEFVSIHQLERELLKSRGFLRLSGWCVRRIVKDDFFNAPELEIYHGVVNWAKANVADDRFMHYLKDSRPALPRVNEESEATEDDGTDGESEETKQLRKMKRCLHEHRLLKAVRFGRIPLDDFVSSIDVDEASSLQLLSGRMLADIYLYHLQGCARISGAARHTRKSFSIVDRNVVEWQVHQLAFLLRARDHVMLPGADLGHGCTWTVRLSADNDGLVSLHFFAMELQRPVEMQKARIVVETGKGELGVKEWVRRSRSAALRWASEEEYYGVVGLMNLSDLKDPIRIQLRLYPRGVSMEEESDESSDGEIVVPVDEDADGELATIEDIDEVATPMVPRKTPAEGVDVQARSEEEDDAGISSDALGLEGEKHRTISTPRCVSMDSGDGDEEPPAPVPEEPASTIEGGPPGLVNTARTENEASPAVEDHQEETEG